MSLQGFATWTKSQLVYIICWYSY